MHEHEQSGGIWVGAWIVSEAFLPAMDALLWLEAGRANIKTPNRSLPITSDYRSDLVDL
ncbi:hypothetical protein [Ruegeria sp.]|uniref:hypothetical protein n=1 Tax=Ruegeria sp. TaxID=1879320 RepID=UPI003B5C051D